MAKNNRAEIVEGDLSQVLSAIDKTVLELISSGAPFSDVLQVLSRMIEEQSPGLLCSILLLDRSGKTLRHGAAPSLPDSYIRAIDGMAIGPCAGSCGTAAYLGKPVIVSDIASDPLWAEYRELGLSHGLRACWSTPIVSRDGKVLGTFATYCREPRSPSQRDWQVIERAAHMAAIAIEREWTEAALRQERAMLDAVLKHLPDQIYFKDRESRFTRVNRALVTWFGLKDAAHVLGKTDFDFFTLEHAQPAFDDEQEIMRTGQPLAGKEEKETWPDGRETWVLTTKMPLRDPQGQIVGTMGISRDITERKRAEEALQESEEKYRALVENSANLIAIYQEGAIKYVNRPMCERLGWTFKELTSPSFDPVQKLIPKHFQALVRANIEKRLRGEHIPPYDIALKTRDGLEIPVMVYATAVTYEGKPADHITHVDITERKRAEEALHESEERFRKLFDEAPVAYHEIDTQGIVRRVNQAECQLLGYQPSEILGKHASEFVAEEERTTSREAIQRKLKGELPLAPFHRKLARADGTGIIVEIHENLIRDGNGTIIGIRSALLDITERKRLEEQLWQALKMEAVGRLAGGIAHDFNNLLMVIKGYCDLMLGRLSPGEPLRKSADEIKKAADRAASLTRQLLAFSRMQVLQPKVLDLNAVVAEMGKMLPRLIGEDIELIIVTRASLGRVRADQSQIEQVILNLVVNARDAMPQGGKLTIETANADLDEEYARHHPRVPPGSYVMLAVSDTGVGMDAETQAHCFEPFFTTKEQGTGLGLATVYGVVKQSGGWIWVYSEPGRGTSFKIYLPRVEEVAEVAEEVEVGKTVGAPPRGFETILLVEDQDGIRELARDFLESCGYAVLVAKDGGEALEIAERQQGVIDLLVTDVVMPKMRGPELARCLSTSRPQLRVLYMSGYAEYAGAHDHGVGDGKTASLQKPVALDTLARKVREVLDAKPVVRLPSKCGG